MAKRTRKKKSEEDLKTLYYYREGTLRIHPTDNSKLGMYIGEWVLVKRFNKDRKQFLVQNKEEEEFWTDMLTLIRPEVDGFELYHTSFLLLIECDYRDGDIVCYRTRNGFSSLKKTIKTSSYQYEIFKDGEFNIDNIPRGFNFVLGYPDNILMQQTENEQ